MIDLSHETALWLSKTVGLLYLIFLFVAFGVHAYWPANRARFDRAGRSILGDEDVPARHVPARHVPARDVPARDVPALDGEAAP